jgi:hypothetical protein
MSHTFWLFTSSLVWEYEGKTLNAVAECWGGGAHGGKLGVGGSGAAYAANTFTLRPGKYEIVIGDGDVGNGGETYLESEDGIIVQAAGGKMDGSNEHQRNESVGKVIFVGGKGGLASSGNGGGGGGCGGAQGDGENGNGGNNSTHKTGAAGGKYNNLGANSSGGVGAFYYAGPGTNEIYRATPGGFPGCGGGGGYNQEGANFSAPGGKGCLVVWLPSD